MNVYQALVYNVTTGLGGPLIRAALHLKKEGDKNIPAEGGALLVANHRSLLDPVAIALCTRRHVNFAAGSFAFGIPLVGQVFKMWGAVPLNVFGGERSREDLDKVVELLQAGELVGVFPEGVHTLARTHKSSKILNFKTGFARVALMARVPIVPIAVVGIGERNLPRVPHQLVKPFFDHPDYRDGVRWIYYRRVMVRIGVPISLEGLYDSYGKADIDRVSGKVRRIIIKLYDGEDRERFIEGRLPFDILYDRV